MALGIAASVILFAAISFMSYEQVQRVAEISQQNIADALASDIKHEMESFSRSLYSAARSVQLPGVWNLPQPVRDAVIFDGAVGERKSTSMAVIGRDGELLAIATQPNPPAVNLSDRDYFKYHRDTPDVTMHVAGPRQSQLYGEPVLSFSLRLADDHGDFAGVVAGGFFLSRFDDLLKALNPGQDGAAGIFLTNGTILARAPFLARAVGADLSGGSLFRRPNRGSSGTYTDVSAIDGVERLVAYRSVDDFPFVVAFSQSTKTVFAPWKQTTLLFVSLLATLCVMKFWAIWALRRERVAHLQAERAAAVSAAALAVANQTLEDRMSAALQERDAAHGKLATSQRMEAIGQLAGGIAHDINNVLQTISGACSLMQTRLRDPTRIEQLSYLALGAAERGGAVTQRLLAFARRAILRTEEVDAIAMLVDLKELLNHTLLGSITLELDIPPSLPPLKADRLQLETVIINLVTNARDATPGGGGKIIISATSETTADLGSSADALDAGTYIRLQVIDRGIGMDADTLARAAEPFFTTKGIGLGTGLGLSMTKGFAEQSGGKLEIVSSLGKGTTVSVWLPAIVSGALPAPRLPALQRSQPFDDSRGGSVLVVDDNHEARELIAELLMSRNFKVHQAASGEAAVAAFDGGLSIDVLVSDLSMPGIDGIELAHLARERLPGLPVIIMTGNTGAVATGAIESAIGEDSCTVLQKPLRIEELSHQINLAFRRCNARKSPAAIGLI